MVISTFSSDDAYEELRIVYGEVLEDLENTTKKYFKFKNSFKTVLKEIDELNLSNKILQKKLRI